LVTALQATGRAFLSSTRLGDRVALRMCFINWRTTAADVEEIVTLLDDLGRKM
jgi:glutamate/tyrosine decarboxylase-like PLP-dependent enzyme